MGSIEEKGRSELLFNLGMTGNCFYLGEERGKEDFIARIDSWWCVRVRVCACVCVWSGADLMIND